MPQPAKILLFKHLNPKPIQLQNSTALIFISGVIYKEWPFFFTGSHFLLLYLSFCLCPTVGCVTAYLSTIPLYLFYWLSHSCHSDPEAEVEGRLDSKSESSGLRGRGGSAPLPSTAIKTRRACSQTLRGTWLSF